MRAPTAEVLTTPATLGLDVMVDAISSKAFRDVSKRQESITKIYAIV